MRRLTQTINGAARHLGETIVQPLAEILRTIDRHAGPAAVGIFVLTGLPIMIVLLPLLLTLILLGALALRLTGTTTRMRPKP